MPACVGNGAVVNGDLQHVLACDEIEFTLPIFSGIFGILMPTDSLRYIPLAYFPNLEFEFTFNPYAFFSSSSVGSRDYVITKFEMYSNVLTFESDIHDALDNVVANTGLHIVSQSFISGPPLNLPTNTVNNTFPITLPLKSVKALFFSFLYETYKNDIRLRKLNRVSHNLDQLQVRVGATAFFPSLPIEGKAGHSLYAAPFITELYKAMGRLHDVTTDTNISTDNYCIDTPYAGNMEMYLRSRGHNGIFTLDDHYNSVFDQASLRNGTCATPVGRNVYGLSMQNISSDVSTINGVNTVVASPFEVLMRSTKGKTSSEASIGLSFVLHDFILYIRPDLQIKILGR